MANLACKRRSSSSGRRSQREQKLAVLSTQRKELERQVQLLSDGSLEKDMLDEEARSQLNMSRSRRNRHFQLITSN